jgi:hypothetical protein
MTSYDLHKPRNNTININWNQNGGWMKSRKDTDMIHHG